MHFSYVSVHTFCIPQLWYPFFEAFLPMSSFWQLACSSRYLIKGNIKWVVGLPAGRQVHKVHPV